MANDPNAEAARQNQEWRNAFSEYIKTKWTQPVHCPICNTTEWSLGSVVDVPMRQPTVFPSGSRSVFIYMPVACDNCGYTIFFNAVSAGLFKSSSDILREAKESEKTGGQPQ